jgi:filamentous hemagglutinin family protein
VAITQTSQKAVINWNSFSIRAGELTTFLQPNAQAIALNRVVGVDPSKIMGTLKANGQVWLVNPNGIVFGKTAQVDVAGLLATTLNISNRDFMAGTYKFSGPENSGAMVVNAGRITVNDTGLAALVAPGVANSGVITARLGKIQLSSAAGFTVDLNGDGTFNFLLDKQVTQQILRANGATPSAAVTNTGSLIADGGTILLTADAAKSVVDHAIDMTGYASARSVSVQGGTIILDGGTEGTVRVSGTLDASAQGPGQSGGTIKVLGGMQNGTVNVSGTLNASAPNGGNGGFIETSAAHVTVADSAIVTTAAPLGKTGTWLIDPNDYTIASSGGHITGSALSTQLTSNNVTIMSSTGASGGNGDVNVNDAVNWSANTFTLTAANNINVNAVMTASGNASLALNPATANGADAAVGTGTVVTGRNSSGNFTGRVDFSGTGTLSISGTPYIVINSLGVVGDTSGSTLQGMNGNLTGHYALGGNIDATATSTWSSGAGFSPIGSVANPFTGQLNGLGHVVSALTINDTTDSQIGLFGKIGSNSLVTSLALTNPSAAQGTPSVTGWSRGVLAGTNGGTIQDITVTNPDVGLVGLNNGTISRAQINGINFNITRDNLAVGAVAGANTGTISQSSASGSITVNGSGQNTGGLAGTNTGTISRSFANVSVNGNVSPNLSNFGTYVGGLVGFNDNGGTITNSYATGTITGGWNPVVGGFVGLNFGSISQSFATGNVTGGSGCCTGTAGGFVGQNSGTVSQAYATGAVSSGSVLAGGFAGAANFGSISESYSIGAVSGSASTTIGAFVGTANATTITNSYFNTDTAGVYPGVGSAPSNNGGSSSITLVGLTSTALKATIPTGFNSAVWAISPSINNGYPYLLALAPSGGTVALIPVTWIVADASGTYGTLASLGAITLSGVSSSDSSSVLGTLGLFSGATAVTLSATTPAGTYSEQVTGLTGSAAGNYSLATSGNTAGTLVIAPKALSWTVADATSTFGTTPTLGTASLSGVVGSDSVNGTAGAFTGSTPVALSTSTPVGTYSENVTGLSGSAAGNYTLASTGNSPGTLTVSAATPAPTPTPTPTPASTPAPTLTTAVQTTTLNQTNNSGPAFNVAGTTPSYVPPLGLTRDETAFIKNLTWLSKLPKTAASDAVYSELAKVLDFFAVNVLTKMSLPSADLVALQNFMIKDLQESFEKVTPTGLTTQVVGTLISNALQDVVQQGLMDRGYSANSNVVVVFRYWTDLAVQSSIGGATSGPAGAIAAAAETSVSTIMKMAVDNYASANQNLTDINWNIATNLQQQQQLVQMLQEAQRANDQNLVAHYEAGLRSATKALKAMSSAETNIIGGPLMWLLRGDPSF